MASSSTNPYPNYPYPSEFNVSDLVPDKLSKSNYSEWKPLMLDFIESRGMNEFIHHTTKDIEDFNDPKKDIEDPYFDDYKERSWRKSDGLVRTWILSTLNRDIVKQVLPYKTAGAVWMALETMLGSRNAQQPDSSSHMEAESRLHGYMPLHIDAIQGDVQKFRRRDTEAFRKPITTERETVLITAVRSVRRNKLVAYVMDKLSAEDLAQRDNLGRTALHEAAEVGNLAAAEMLVTRNPSLANMKDKKEQTPLLCAAKTGNREMVRFLLKCVEGSVVSETGPIPPTILYHLANSGLCVAPAKLRNNATKNPAVNENRQNPPAVTDIENPDENPQSGAVNPAVNENRQNPPAVADTENSIADENPQSGAVNPVVDENQQNPLAVTENSIFNENTQNAAVNSAVNENRQNPPAVTDTENSVVDENPQSGAVNPVVNENQQNPLAVTENSVVNENLQNAAVNPVVNENPQIINENLQNLIVTDNSIVNENLQIRIDITEDFVVNENLQNPTVYETPHNDIDNPQNPVNNDNLGNRSDLVVDGIAHTSSIEMVQQQTAHTSSIGTAQQQIVHTSSIGTAQQQTAHTSSIGTAQQQIAHTRSMGTAQQQTAHTSSIETAQQQTGRWHAIHWHVADQSVPAIKHIREIKLKHDEALELVKCLCKEIAKLEFSTATWMFTPALAQATSSGITEIVEEILRSYPTAISFKNENDQSIFQSAIVWRRENVFNLIYQLKECSHKFLSVPDRFGNNALHLAGCLGPQQHLSVRVSAAGAALQMQRELQWFKEVEKFVLPQDKECRNDDGMTPAEVFTKTHKELVEAGERWMKDTATSCTIVAALIATVMFAAAITVPGGNNASSGVSTFSKQKAFVIFGLFDALALFTSIASLLLFLSILTARYAEEDFLYSLPNRLIRGLIYLFLSISSTMTAFGATLYLMMGENRPWIIYPIVSFAYIPVHLFVSLLFPLLGVMLQSTYRPAIFGKQSDHMLF